jgi:hypothetical protein
MLQATEAVEAELEAAQAALEAAKQALKALDAESDRRRVEGTLEVHAAGLVAHNVAAHDHEVTTR